MPFFKLYKELIVIPVIPLQTEASPEPQFPICLKENALDDFPKVRIFVLVTTMNSALNN